MIRFNCDYSEGAHERILKKLAETNLEQTPGYGEDHYCAEAAGIIRRLCGREDAAVHFLVGGTQANLTVIASALRSHQGAVGAVTAHINVHETGSIEATGHKVLALPSEDGKITAEQVEELYQAHIRDESFEHTVQPKMVYISNPTELGTIYTRAEMENLYGVCRKYGLYLFVDGARLAYGLAAEGNDLDLKSLAASCDVFYIGGTKVGALFGEAVVILNDELKADFRYHIKQRGGMLAKGRLLGIQFGELLRDGWAAPAMMVIGARLETNIARMCWRPKGMALAMGTLPSSLYMLLMLQLVLLFMIGSPYKMIVNRSLRFCG